MKTMAGYTNTPLVSKLGIREGFKIKTFNAPDHYYRMLDSLPEQVESLAFTDPTQVDFIHFFTHSSEELEQEIERLKASLKKNGMLWISWPKKASKVPTDLSDMMVRNAGLKIGLVDVKVCAVDEIWSGLKFVFRKEDR